MIGDKIYHDILEITDLLCSKHNVDLDKESSELTFYSGITNINMEDFDNIIKCYIVLNYLQDGIE